MLTWSLVDCRLDYLVSIYGLTQQEAAQVLEM